MGHPKIDFTGRVFESLKVIREFSIPYNGKQNNRNTLKKLECLCDCGAIFYPYKTNVATGKTTGCGRCVKSKVLLGKQIGKLTVLRRDLGSTSCRFFCLCKCGEESSIKSRYLREGKHPQSCEKCRHFKKFGPPKMSMQDSAIIRGTEKHLKTRKSLVGKKVNNVWVLRFSRWQQCEKRRRAIYLCRCKCSNEFECSGSHVRLVLGCGCKESRFRPGKVNWRALFTEMEVKAIREMIISKMYTQRKIAQMFGVTENLISSIKHKKVYVNI